MSMKLNQSVEDILEDKNIAESIDFLKLKKNACGDDGVWLHDLEEYWKLNKEKICHAIKTCSYNPNVVHEKVIVTANGIDRIFEEKMAEFLKNCRKGVKKSSFCMNGYMLCNCK